MIGLVTRFFFCLSIFFLTSYNVYSKPLYFGAPNKIIDWKISCKKVDKGSIVRKKNNYIFKTSKNYCPEGDWKQRAELISVYALSTNTKAQYNFQSYFNMKSDYWWPGYDNHEKFDIFQIHDGRDGCAPPLKVNIQPDGKIKLRGDYKKGPGEKCVYDIIKSTGRGKTKIKRDGTEYKLNILLDFDGNGGFEVEVYINDEFEVSGEYRFEAGLGYIKSRYFAFKHGVYSRFKFPYVLDSVMTMERIN